MCTPFTRSVYLLLDHFVGPRNEISLKELDRAIAKYDWALELRANRQLVRRTLENLIVDGSVRRIAGGKLEITPKGLKARAAARQYASPEPAAA